VGSGAIEVTHEQLGKRYLTCEGAQELLFTENETNYQMLFNGENTSAYVKDGINDYVVNAQSDAVNPEKTGTKASPYHVLEIGAGAKQFSGNSNWYGSVWMPVKLRK
jgi:hypothetical protein